MNWHLLHCSGIDTGLLECLRRTGYEYYRPMIRLMRPIPKKLLSHKQRKHPGEYLRAVERALFPSYLFVRVSDSDVRRHEVFDTLGLHRISLRSDRSPVVMPDEFIDDLRSREQGGAIPADTPAKVLPYKLGDSLKILEGSFAGLTGTLADLDEHGIISLLVDLLGRKVRVSNLTLVEVASAVSDRVPSNHMV